MQNNEDEMRELQNGYNMYIELLAKHILCEEEIIPVIERLEDEMGLEKETRDIAILEAKDRIKKDGLQFDINDEKLLVPSLFGSK